MLHRYIVLYILVRFTLVHYSILRMATLYIRALYFGEKQLFVLIVSVLFFIFCFAHFLFAAL